MGGAAAAAIASDLGARAIREELDALRVMGVDPVRHLSGAPLSGSDHAGSRPLRDHHRARPWARHSFLSLTVSDVASGSFWNPSGPLRRW